MKLSTVLKKSCEWTASENTGYPNALIGQLYSEFLECERSQEKMIGLEDLQIEASLDFYWPKFCTWTEQELMKTQPFEEPHS